MTLKRILLALAASLSVRLASASVLYVDVNSVNPVPPYSDWSTAATNIQDAVDAANAGDTVLVTNGFYQTGSRAVYVGMFNRVAIMKPVMVQSVNGAAVTTIQGAYENNGPVRCVYLTNGASLSGFTLSGGVTKSGLVSDLVREGSGGGILCESTNSIVSNCVLSGNTGYYYAGGVYGGTLNNCILSNNAVFGWGGGAYGATLNDCFLAFNLATSMDGGGGASDCVLSNCTLKANSGYQGAGAHNSTLADCILEGNFGGNGGGSFGSVVYNCSFIGNSAASSGGGAYTSFLINCLFTGNSTVGTGGAVSQCGATNCTILSNSANNSGGGAYNSKLKNSILYYNSAPTASNYFGGSLDYCCSLPLPTNGFGNVDLDPQLASTSHISSNSPCRSSGSSVYATGFDIDGEAWADPPSIGCDQYNSGTVTGLLSVAVQGDYRGAATGLKVNFAADIFGKVSASQWDFGDGTFSTNQPYASHAWTNPGGYQVVLTAYNETYPNGIRAEFPVQILDDPVHYVSETNSNPAIPYTSWASAATNIQDAVDAAFAGAKILVNDGIYNTGGRLGYGLMSNRVAVTKPILVESARGPGSTFIEGYQVPGSIQGDTAVRCVYLTNGASLIGFTLTNGATRGRGDVDREESGGGVWCESNGAIVSNCVITGNAAWMYGGAAIRGTLANCSISWNQAAIGGGVHAAALKNCILSNNLATAAGGGASYASLDSCAIGGNKALAYGGGWGGGGEYLSSLNNCVLVANSSSDSGGAAFYGTLNNCTVVGNSATNSCGGAIVANLNNSIVYYNTAPRYQDYSGCSLNYCCAPVVPASGQGNFTNLPLFLNLSGDLHLQSNSPCINAGNNAYAPSGRDMDGNPRIVGGTVDIGAYEFQHPTSVISYVWLEYYGLPIDGSADYADPDHDGMNNWQEWVAGTDPTNALSALLLLAPTSDGTNVVVTWESVAGVNYSVERSSSLAGTFTPLVTGIAGQPSVTSFADTNAVGSTPFFYRVSVAGP